MEYLQDLMGSYIFNESNTFYGSGRIWVLAVVLHNFLHMFLNLQVEYMTLGSLMKKSCNKNLFFPCFVYIYTAAVLIVHCG